MKDKELINEALKEYGLNYEDLINVFEYKEMVFYGDRDNLIKVVEEFINFFNKQLIDLKEGKQSK